MANNIQKKIYLWTIPRSLSTAFLRAMLTLDGCKGFFEPYQMAFYDDGQYPIYQNIPEQFRTTHEKVKMKLETAYPEAKVVFIKAMGKHLVGKLDDPSYIPETCTHTFLIRNPLKTMKSFVTSSTKIFESIPEESRQKKTLEWMKAEESFEYIVKVFDTVTTMYKQKPIIIDADDIQANPEGTLRAYCNEVGIEYQDSMVHWGPITEEQKKVWSLFENFPEVMPFLDVVLNATELMKSEPKVVRIEEIDETFRGLVLENMPLYYKMYEQRLKPLEI